MPENEKETMRPDPNVYPYPPPPYQYDTAIQRLRNAVKAAATAFLAETSVAPQNIEMQWSESSTGDRTMRKMKVDFATDALDAELIWMPEIPDMPFAKTRSE